MHNSEDRGMLKWQPFYSVLSEDEIRSSIKNKDKISKPELSEDQIAELENLVVEAYNNKNNVELKIYNNNRIMNVTGIITKLDPIHKAIYLNKKMILFENIIELKSA